MWCVELDHTELKKSKQISRVLSNVAISSVWVPLGLKMSALFSRSQSTWEFPECHPRFRSDFLFKSFIFTQVELGLPVFPPHLPPALLFSSNFTFGKEDIELKESLMGEMRRKMRRRGFPSILVYSEATISPFPLPTPSGGQRPGKVPPPFV